MAKGTRSHRLTVILHADIAGSTSLVHQDETLAHERIQDTFNRFTEIIAQYHGHTRELRGDALLAEFDRVSSAVSAALAFQYDQSTWNDSLNDSLQPKVRVGIAMGEVIVGDDTITGAGVVLAQRIEQLARPGGICISGAIHEALPQRMPFDHDYLGEQILKGFDEPVRVYATKLTTNQTVPPPHRLGQPSKSFAFRNRIIAAAVVMVLIAGGLIVALNTRNDFDLGSTVGSTLLSDAMAKPSIAVLPFENMSTDRDQEYFADGITDDLITDLTKIPALLVIARDSTFFYKDQTLDVRDIGKRLNALYVLHGSVRQHGNTLRINAQLVDTRSGKQLWADRYDGESDDVFTLQDNITEQIVTSLSINLETDDYERLTRRETDNLEAYDLFLRARDRFFLFSRDGIEEAQGLLNKALQNDERFATAHALMGWSYVSQAMNGWRDREESLTLAKQYAGRSIELNGNIPLSYFVTGLVYRERGDWSKALLELEKATEIDPNYANAHVLASSLLYYDGRPEEGLERMKVAIRLNPHNPSNYAFHLGQAYYILEQYPEAIQAFLKGLESLPSSERLHVWLSAAYGQAGQLEDAAWEVDEVMTLNPDFSLENMSEAFPFRKPEDSDHFFEGLRKAGFER